MSASGQTLYIEPNAVVALNNSLNQTKIEEKNEISRLLRQLSEDLKPYTNDIRQNAWLLGHMDLIKAKANFMVQQKASIPILADHKISLCMLQGTL